MATEEGPRRSGRARKTVISLAEEQAEQTAADAAIAATAPKRGKKRARTIAAPPAKPASSSKDTVDDDHVDEYLSAAPEHDPDEEAEEVQEAPPPKKVKRSSKKKDAKASGQLYGAAPVGTMIPWLPGRMRKQPQVWEVKKKDVGPVKINYHADAAASRIDARLANLKVLLPGEEEYRVLPDVDFEDLDEKYHAALQRAMSQKMFVLERTRGIEEDCHAHHEDCPYETLQLAGSTGNVYTVRISHLTVCNCSVGVFQKKGQEQQCKHVLYVLNQVLRAPDHLKYQQAFLTSELKELFANAPPLPSQVAEDSAKDGNRKPIEGDCPICFQEFDDETNLVWCKAACGNNLHADCFKHWESARNPVPCPFCRSHWQGDGAGNKQKTTVMDVNMPMMPGKGGYYNVADQLDYT